MALFDPGYESPEAKAAERLRDARENPIYLAKGPIVGAILIAAGILAVVWMIVWMALNLMFPHG